MKIYCFYLIKNHISTYDYPALQNTDIFAIENKECALYAYTPEKESYKYFIKTRNMNIFFKKVIDMSRKEYDEFTNDNPSQVIEYHSFNTKQIVDGIYKSKQIHMLCTTIESDFVLYRREEMVLELFSQDLSDKQLELINNAPFKRKIKNILNEIFMFNDILNKIAPNEDFNFDEFNIDDVSLYIRLFANTFKEEIQK